MDTGVAPRGRSADKLTPIGRFRNTRSGTAWRVLEGADGGAWETAYIYMDTGDDSRGLRRASPICRARRPPVSADRAGPRSAGRARHRCRPSTATLPEEAGILSRRAAASLRHRWDAGRPGARRRVMRPVSPPHPATASLPRPVVPSSGRTTVPQRQGTERTDAASGASLSRSQGRTEHRRLPRRGIPYGGPQGDSKPLPTWFRCRRYTIVDAATGPGPDTGLNLDPLRLQASRWRPVPQAARRQPPPTSRSGVSRSRGPWRPSRCPARAQRPSACGSARVASGDSSSGTRRWYGSCHGEGRLRQHAPAVTRTA